MRPEVRTVPRVSEHNSEPKWLEIPQFQGAYRIGKTKIYELVGRGQLEMVKVGRKSLISVASAERLFASLPRAGQ